MSAAVDAFLAKGGEVQKLDYVAPRWAKQKMAKKYMVYNIGRKASNLGRKKCGVAAPSPVAK